MRKRNWIIAAVLLSFAPPAFAGAGFFTDHPEKLGEQRGLPSQDEHTDAGAGGCAVLDAGKSSAAVSGSVYKASRGRQGGAGSANAGAVND